MALQKKNKLILPADLVEFLHRVMKKHGRGEVVITVHAADSRSESIWRFIVSLEPKRD